LRFTKEENEFLERRSTENLIEIYRQELLRILSGENCFKLLPRSVRRRLGDYGILKRFGSRYEVTTKGKKMLR